VTFALSSTHVERTTNDSPSSATFRRRRAVAAAVTAVVIGVGVQFGTSVLSGPGGVPASATGAATAPSVVHVRAAPGDSLWSIAERFHGDVALTRYVDALIRLNGGTAIAAGQLVRLP
jgi:hypothetical protein